MTRSYQTVMTSANRKTGKSGSAYWELKAPGIGLKGAERTILIFLNPLWPAAQAEAEAVQGRNKVPQWTMTVADYDRPENSYNGTGALWKRAGKVSGSFTFNDTQYVSNITSNKAEIDAAKAELEALVAAGKDVTEFDIPTAAFTLTLNEVVEITLDELVASV